MKSRRASAAAVAINGASRGMAHLVELVPQGPTPADAAADDVLVVIRDGFKRTHELLQAIYGELCGQRIDAKDRTLDYDGAAEFLDCSVRHLKHLVALREIPHRRKGRRVQFLEKDLADWQRRTSHYPRERG